MIKVDDIKSKLTELGMTAEEIDSIKGKANLVEALNNLSALDNLEEEKDGVEVEKQPIKMNNNNDEFEEAIPDYNSVDWEPYVMSKFTKDELVDNKFPKMSGLRRVGGLLLGDVLFAGTVREQLELPTDGPGRASVLFRLVLVWKLGMSPTLEGDDLPIKEFTALGGSYIGNTDDNFAIFPEAIAETRAEARAWRRALRLSVCSSDELTRKNQRTVVEESTVPIAGSSNTITDNQVNVINVMCKRLGVAVDKFINMGTNKYKDIREIPYDKAIAMINRLNQYQRTGEDSLPIPDYIKS